MGRPPIVLERTPVTWLAYGQLALWAYFIYAFSPVVPLLRDEQHTSRGLASLHGTAFAVSAVLSGLVLPALVRRFGREVVVWLGLAGVSLGTAGFLVAHRPWATIACTLVASFFGSLAVIGIVAVLSDRHGPAGPAAISEANAVAAGVGILAPLAVGAAVAAGWGWRPGLVALVGGVALVGAVAMIFRVRLPAGRLPTGDRPARRPLPRRYWLVWVCIAATGGIEFSLNLWSGDLLRSRSHVTPAVAPAAVSALLVGMFVGRVAGGRLALRYRVEHLLLGSLALSAAGFALFWSADVAWLALVGLVGCGLGTSLHYPLGVSLAVLHSDGQPERAVARSAYAIGLAFGAAPYALGVLADRAGPHRAFGVVGIFLGVAMAAIVVLVRIHRPDLDRVGTTPLEPAAPAAIGAPVGLAAPGDGDAVGDRQ